MASNEVNINREIENVIGTIFGAIFKPIGYGIKKLRDKKIFIGFIFVLIMGLTISFIGRDYIPYLSYAVFIPIPYMWITGAITHNDISKSRGMLDSIGFVGRDGKAPVLVEKKIVDKRITELTFQSLIPFGVWEENKELLETVLDRNIVFMKPGKSKKRCVISCLPSGYLLPESILWNDDFIDESDGAVIIGEDALGQIKFNLNKLPHVISAGETGSGKSVLLRCIAWQLIKKGAKPYFLDFKGGVEFGLAYEKYGEVITEPQRALEVLDLLVKENATRLAFFREKEIKNLAEYNSKYKKKLCRIVVVIDEIAELLDKKGKLGEEKEMLNMIEGRLASLARLSRATGINLLLGAQRPDANVLPGQIKNNAPIRICGKFADRSASDIVLGNSMATKLPEIKGRFMYKVGPQTTMFQAYYFDDDKMLKSIDIPQGQMMMTRKKKKHTA